jgi:hypothetical protein
MKTMLKPPLETIQQSATITTSLYELVEAVQSQVGPEDDELVIATVMYILRARRATFLRHRGASHCN